jgi:hypothetical protein
MTHRTVANTSIGQRIPHPEHHHTFGRLLGEALVDDPREVLLEDDLSGTARIPGFPTVSGNTSGMWILYPGGAKRGSSTIPIWL